MTTSTNLTSFRLLVKFSVRFIEYHNNYQTKMLEKLVNLKFIIFPTTYSFSFCLPLLWFIRSLAQKSAINFLKIAPFSTSMKNFKEVLDDNSWYIFQIPDNPYIPWKLYFKGIQIWPFRPPNLHLSKNMIVSKKDKKTRPGSG